ncbi:WD40/YVTN/BNR-like repeat-containing protein [Candidatus Uabimicrobium sp. HlEnr_7]|uniref:WD40/YVTN/BNR-like repeat-containing protein n=1 Tax=Candidatus Uabimicrobium helgolandensis TaxID=3095367 RepID=UPI003557B730
MFKNIKNHKEFLFFLSVTTLAILLSLSFVKDTSLSNNEQYATHDEEYEEGDEKDSKPTDWFIRQRMGTNRNQFNFAAFRKAKDQSAQLLSSSSSRAAWEFVGPTNIGGRICDVEMDPTNPNVAYFAAASGGIFKTTDQGETWFPIFDNEMTLNTGDICLAPSNPNIIYVGTGEVNPGGGSITYPGLGVFKSVDAGKTWTHLGLDKTQCIGRVKVHPTNPDIVYVAATGALYGESEDRGVYRSQDGGQSWEKVLFVSTKTGCVDMAIDPKDPNNLYAAMWERIRRPGYQKYGGTQSAIYRSQDGGNTWAKLAGGLPKSDENTGRIGIDICQSQPNVLYTCFSTTSGDHLGVFKTTNGGDSWKQTNDSALYGGVGTYAWWFSNIRVDPNDPSVVFFLGFNFYRTQNGGNSWQNVGYDMHVDHHALYIHPLDSSICLAGNDGGVYLSKNSGSRWKKSDSLPITQFYSLAVDPKDPNRILAGAQDNGVNFIATGSKTGWKGVIGGDGLDVAFDPTNSNYAYGESQYGAFRASSNGGRSFGWGGSGISGTKGWKCPIAVDPTNGHVYFGSNKIYRSTDHGSYFSAVSPKLTTNDKRDPFGTITTIAVSASNSNYVYTGTDDGNVWVTTNHGKNWNNISQNIPKEWITSIAVDPTNEQVAYLTVSGYRWDKHLAHVFMTTDAGKNWKAISGNLPEAPVNGIVTNSRATALYVASDVGVFMSKNQGQTWETVGKGLPSIVIHELDYHIATNTLFAGTFGRGIYKIDVSQH